MTTNLRTGILFAVLPTAIAAGLAWVGISVTPWNGPYMWHPEFIDLLFGLCVRGPLEPWLPWRFITMVPAVIGASLLLGLSLQVLAPLRLSSGHWVRITIAGLVGGLAFFLWAELGTAGWMAWLPWLVWYPCLAIAFSQEGAGDLPADCRN